MLCDICGTLFRRVESSLICENGHTIQNTLEVGEDNIMQGVARSRFVKKMNIATEKKRDLDNTVANMLVIHCLFYEAKKHFGFTDDWIYKQFTGFYAVLSPEPEDAPLSATQGAPEENDHPAFLSQPAPQQPMAPKKAIIYGSFQNNLGLLIAVIYLSKRVHEEKQGRPFLVDQFRSIYTSFDLEGRCYDIVKRQRLFVNGYKAMTLPLYVTIPVAILHNLQNLANFNYYENLSDYSVHHDTGVIPQYVLDLKQNIRSVVRRDLTIWQAYFDIILKKLKVKKTNRLKYFFKKMVYVLHPKEIFVPEVTICLFLAIYMNNKDKFTGSKLEQKILIFLNISRKAFTRKISLLVINLNAAASPEKFTRYREYMNQDYLSSLRSACLLVKALKRVKKPDAPKE